MKIGIDVVDIERLRTVLARSPVLAARFFTAAERSYCGKFRDSVVRLAGGLAAKEAVMKALGLTPAPAWARRIEILHSSAGSPVATVDGREVPISISHDGGVAIAMAFVPEGSK